MERHYDGIFINKQVSEKWRLSTRRINVLCSEGRIPGATKIGSYWAIPAEAEKPKDARIKSESMLFLLLIENASLG